MSVSSVCPFVVTMVVFYLSVSYVSPPGETMPFAVLVCLLVSDSPLLLLSLRPCSRFGLVGFRLSCDHGWIRSGSSVNKCEINNNVLTLSATKS